MPELNDLQKDLQTLAADLKRLEAEYNMFFAGRLPRPPWETRGRVEAMFKRYDRGQIQSTGDRFKFEMLQSRFQALVDLWDRGMRAREEGRPGPFAQQAPKVVKKREADPKVVQIRRAGEEPSQQTARSGEFGSGVPRCGEGREGRVYGEGCEGPGT